MVFLTVSDWSFCYT